MFPVGAKSLEGRIYHREPHLLTLRSFKILAGLFNRRKKLGRSPEKNVIVEGGDGRNLHEEVLSDGLSSPSSDHGGNPRSPSNLTPKDPKYFQNHQHRAAILRVILMLLSYLAGILTCYAFLAWQYDSFSASTALLEHCALLSTYTAVTATTSRKNGSTPANPSSLDISSSQPNGEESNGRDPFMAAGKDADAVSSTKCHCPTPLTTGSTAILRDYPLPEEVKKQQQEELCQGEVLPSGGYCLSQEKLIKAHQTDKQLARALAELVFQGDSVTDLGAGLGDYGYLWLFHPTHPVRSYTALDGAMNVELYSNGMVRYADLTQPAAHDRRSCADVADWVVSLEVAEHIPPQYTDAYLRNIRCRALKGAVISWADPDQSGFHHVNGQTGNEVLRRVEGWGLEADWETTALVRQRAKFGWFRENVIVYRLPATTTPPPTVSTHPPNPPPTGHLNWPTS